MNNKSKMAMGFAVLLLAACGSGGATLTGDERRELTDYIVTTDPSVSGEIPPATPNGFRP